MVTFLDVGISQYLNIIFSVLLIFAIVFAILYKTKILGENATINAIVAIALALLSMLSGSVIKLVNFISPWFVMVFIFLILLLLAFQVLGATGKTGDILSILKGEKTVMWALVGISLIILFAGGAHVFGEKMASYSGQTGATGETGTGEAGAGTSDFAKSVWSILFSPTVLGLIFIFLVAIFAVIFLSSG